jgi:hypothetical protein
MIPISTGEYRNPMCQCFRAAVASILEISIQSTPSESGYEVWDTWADANNARILAFDVAGDAGSVQPCLFAGEPGKILIEGYSLGLVNLDDGKHAVVLFDGKIVHDPHQDQIAVTLKVAQEQIFVPSNPAKPMTFWRLDAARDLRRWRPINRSETRQIHRAIRWHVNRKRWTERLLKSWAKIDAEEDAA